MTQRNIEVLKKIYDAFNRRDLALIAHLCTPDISWRWGKGPFFESDRVGIAAVQEFLAEWSRAFPDVRVDLEQAHGEGDRVVVFLQQSGSGLSSAAPTGMTFAQVVTFEDGKVRDVRNYLDRGDALETWESGS